MQEFRMRRSSLLLGLGLIAVFAAAAGQAIQRRGQSADSGMRHWLHIMGIGMRPAGSVRQSASTVVSPPRPDDAHVARSGADRASESRARSARTSAYPGTARISRPSRWLPTLAVGSWRERILRADGSLNPEEYVRIANSYNTGDILDYRLGPDAADYANVSAPPTLWGPDATGRGLWPFGTQPASNPGEPNKCVTSDQLPRSDEEELARGMRGAGWQTAGQHLFLPDAGAAAQFRYGMSNTRMADGNRFDTGGLCLRLRASWEADWWNRNNISNPTTPEIASLLSQAPTTPLPAVAIARAKGNVGHAGFAAFRNGRIVPMRVGNSDYENLFAQGVQLPAGMVPTAMAVSGFNEFLYVAVWDTAAIRGRVAVIALRPRQQAVGAPWQTQNTRYYWGMPGAWTVTGMKLLGLVDLPFFAPSSIDAFSNVDQGSPRGHNDNDAPSLGSFAQQSARDRWFNTPWDTRYGEDYWRQNPQYGYLIVASRAEGKVAFVNLRPLYAFYRQMYLTTQPITTRPRPRRGRSPSPSARSSCPRSPRCWMCPRRPRCALGRRPTPSSASRGWITSRKPKVCRTASTPRDAPTWRRWTGAC
jgi:hypothetical protein